VRATPTHPEAQVLGWDRFGAFTQGTTLPVYALGGINSDDLNTAWSRGAHGIAMVRGSW